MRSKNSQSKEFWQEKIEAAKVFSGADTEFCRVHGLNNTTFKNWKYRLTNKPCEGKEEYPPKPLKNPFLAVEVQSSRTRQLPDPRWVAELIFHLQKGG